MAHYPKPFFRPTRGLWYVQIAGKQFNLGNAEAAAFEAYHALMQQHCKRPNVPPTLASSPARPAITILDEFLDWCEKHRAPETYRWYKDRINSFCKTLEPTLPVDQLRPHHVQKWVDDYGVPLASGSRRNLIASVKRGMKWAEEQGYIERSPIAHLKKPACGRKEQVVSLAEFEALLARYKDQEFKDLLTVTWETGLKNSSRNQYGTNHPRNPTHSLRQIPLYPHTREPTSNRRSHHSQTDRRMTHLASSLTHFALMSTLCFQEPEGLGYVNIHGNIC